MSVSESSSTSPSIPPLECTELPALFQDANAKLLQPQEVPFQYVTHELDVSRLDTMVADGLLWLAGRLGNVRPLHHQQLLGRRVVVTERLSLHLLWKDKSIFIKPLPLWTLDDGFVSRYVKCNKSAYAAMNGLLITYARLIQYRSDFEIARAEYLLPQDMQWADWKNITRIRLLKLAVDIAAGQEPCAPRFSFGELRLGRVNLIYRFSVRPWSLRDIVLGYHRGTDSYKAFLYRNFAWLVSVFAWMAIVLTALQVGLAVDDLGDSQAFQHASYGFAVCSVMLPLLALLIGISVSLFLTVYHVGAARRHLQRSHLSRQESETA